MSTYDEAMQDLDPYHLDRTKPKNPVEAVDAVYSIIGQGQQSSEIFPGRD